MATITASLLSASCMAIGFLVFTMSTVTPFDNIGVMTIKMISSTSITSTIGVTLMSATGGGETRFFISLVAIVFSLGIDRNHGSPFRSSRISTRQIPDSRTRRLRALLAYAALRTLQEIVDQFGTGIPHLHVKGFNFARKEVVHPDRRDGHEQTDSGGHQGFRNTAGHGAQTGGLLGRNAAERVDDPYHRSQQSYERSRGTDGSQAADAALQFGVHDGFGAFQSPLGGFDLFARDFRTDLMSLEFLQTGHHNLGEVALLVTVRDLDGFVQFALAQCAGHRRSKCARLFTCSAVRHQTVYHDANGIG